MAFYFALLNVSKKDDKEKHHKRHQRRHSIASVESPLLDYRLLPRPQLLSDDIVIANDLAETSMSQAPLSRRCRGSARASKWVQDNHSRDSRTPGPSGPSQGPGPPLCRSKRMAFGEERRIPRREGQRQEEEERTIRNPQKGQKGGQRMRERSEDDMKMIQQEERTRRRQDREGSEDDKRMMRGIGVQRQNEGNSEDDAKFTRRGGSRENLDRLTNRRGGPQKNNRHELTESGDDKRMKKEGRQKEEGNRKDSAEEKGRGQSEGRQQKPKPKVQDQRKKPAKRQKSQSHSEDDLDDKEKALGRKKESKGMKREGRARERNIPGLSTSASGPVSGFNSNSKDLLTPTVSGALAPVSQGKRALENRITQKVEKKAFNFPTFSIGNVGNAGNAIGTSSSTSRIPVSTTPTSKTLQTALQSSFPLTISISSSSSRHFSPPTSNGLKPIFRGVGNSEDRPQHPSIFQMMAGSATDESGRSSSQMSNESTTPRRDDSPASSCDSKEREVTMKLSGISMSSRSSEPRLKKVTFESSPYVISNSFLGDGAGSGVLVVRRNSGTAVRRMPWTSRGLGLAPHEEVSGDDWWTRCGGEEATSENQMNRSIEKSQGTRSILRRGLIRRRSTSDKTRLLAYRNTGFLSSSQERKSESTSTSRMTVSVDRPKYK